MIFSYGLTQQGTYHKDRNMPCQDAHSIIKLDDMMAVGAVADGLGSEEYSDIASKIAADVSSNYCAEHITESSSDDDIIDVIKTSFQLALNEIECTTEDDHNALDQYDTTLSLAVIRNGSLYYGHSGDSGIVALTTEGLYCKVTEQQRDEYGCVYPLCFDNKWIFNKFDREVVSVFLATDGMFETLFPVFIQNEDPCIYVKLAQYFMDPRVLDFENNTEEDVSKRIATFMDTVSAESVSDDKTVAVITDTSIKYDSQPQSYYEEPNWNVLRERYKEEWRKKAYPNLFKDENGINDSVSDIGENEDDSTGGQKNIST